MADFETKLHWLSERGDPVGAEELIERIEADLAGDPLVVVNKRREGTLMTKTTRAAQRLAKPNHPRVIRHYALAHVDLLALIVVGFR